jgi:ribosome-associated toxin RatA of RatAB toxin-antitoxin module
MFDLVADVESYPQFLKGCVGARLHGRSGDELNASLRMQRGPLTAEFTTRNRLCRPEAITMRLTDGPFETLEGGWRFDALGEEGCRITLSLRFQFSNSLKDLLLGPVFESLCSEFVDAFVRRAREQAQQVRNG